MTEQEIKLSANYIKKLASFSDAEDRISLYLDSLFANQQMQKDAFDAQKNTDSSVSSKLIFTQKENNFIGHEKRQAVFRLAFPYKFKFYNSSKAVRYK